MKSSIAAKQCFVASGLLCYQHHSLRDRNDNTIQRKERQRLTSSFSITDTRGASTKQVHRTIQEGSKNVSVRNFQAQTLISPAASLWSHPQLRTLLLAQQLPPTSYLCKATSTVRLRPFDRSRNGTQIAERRKRQTSANDEDLEEEESIESSGEERNDRNDQRHEMGPSDVKLIYQQTHHTKIIDVTDGTKPYTSSSYMLFTDGGRYSQLISEGDIVRRVGYGSGVRREGHVTHFQDTIHLPLSDPPSGANFSGIGVSSFRIVSASRKARNAMRNLAAAVADDETVEKMKDIRPYFASQKMLVEGIQCALKFTTDNPKDRDGLVAIPSLSQQKVAAYMQFQRALKINKSFGMKVGYASPLMPFELVETTSTSVIPHEYLPCLDMTLNNTNRESSTISKYFDPRKISEEENTHENRVKQFYVFKSTLLRKRFLEHKKFMENERSSGKIDELTLSNTVSEDELLSNPNLTPRVRMSDVHAVITLLPVAIVGLGDLDAAVAQVSLLNMDETAEYRKAYAQKTARIILKHLISNGAASSDGVRNSPSSQEEECIVYEPSVKNLNTVNLVPTSLFAPTDPTALLHAASSLAALAHEETVFDAHTQQQQKLSSQSSSKNFYGPVYLRVPYISDVVLTHSLTTSSVQTSITDLPHPTTSQSTLSSPALIKEALVLDILQELGEQQRLILTQTIKKALYLPSVITDESNSPSVVISAGMESANIQKLQFPSIATGNDSCHSSAVPHIDITIHMPQPVGPKQREDDVAARSLNLIYHPSGELFSIAPGRDMVYQTYVEHNQQQSSNKALSSSSSLSVVSDLATGHLFVGSACGKRVWWGGTRYSAADTTCKHHVDVFVDSNVTNATALRSQLHVTTSPVISGSDYFQNSALFESRKRQLDFIKEVAEGGEIKFRSSTNADENVNTLFLPSATALLANSFGDLLFSASSGIDSDASIQGYATNAWHQRRVGVMGALYNAVLETQLEIGHEKTSEATRLPTRIRDVSDLAENVAFAESMLQSEGNRKNNISNEPNISTSDVSMYNGRIFLPEILLDQRTIKAPYFGKIVEDFAFEKPFYSRDAKAAATVALDAISSDIQTMEDARLNQRSRNFPTTTRNKAEVKKEKSLSNGDKPVNHGVQIFSTLLRQKLFETKVDNLVSQALVSACEVRNIDASRFLEMTINELTQMANVAKRHAKNSIDADSDSSTPLEVLESLQRALNMAMK